MSPSIPAVCPPLLFLLVLTGACGPVRSSPPHPPAASVLRQVGDHYAELERIADSVTAETDAGDTASGELTQVVARNLAGHIGRVRGGFEAVTVAMNTDQLERTRPLWVRMAVTEAALDLLYEDATRLASDPGATADELNALSSQLSGSLELGRVSSRIAADQVEPQPALP